MKTEKQLKQFDKLQLGNINKKLIEFSEKEHFNRKEKRLLKKAIELINAVKLQNPRWQE